MASTSSLPATPRRDHYRYLEAPLRRPLLVLVPTALMALVGVAAGLLLPERYRTATVVGAEWESEDDAAALRLGADLEARRLQAVRQRLLSHAATERLPSTVSVTPRGTNAFVIECVDRDPAMAAQVPNRLADLLVTEAGNERVKRAASDPRLLEARLQAARKVLEETQAALRSQAGGVKAGVQASGTVEPAVEADAGDVRRERLLAERRALDLDLSAARARADRLQRSIDAESRPVVADAGASAELARLRAQRAELRKKYTEEHPDVEALTRRIRKLEAAVPSSVAPTPNPQLALLRAQLAEVEGELEALGQNRDRLDAEITRPTGRARPAKPPKPDLGALTRQRDQAQTAYLSLEEEWRAAEAAARLGRGPIARFVVLAPARVPTKPYFPNRVMLALASVVVGLMLGLMACVVAEARVRSIAGPEDLQALLPQPVLAEISFVKAGSSRKNRAQGEGAARR